MRDRLESYFEFARLGTNWRTEILAGVTTFLTMAYIVLVNPAILADAGVPLAAVTAATCLSAAFGSILMGVWRATPSRWRRAWASTPISLTRCASRCTCRGRRRWARSSFPA